MSSIQHTPIAYRRIERTPVGRGAFVRHTSFAGDAASKMQGKVFKAIAEGSDEVIAYKKSRVSLRVQRTTLRHEARVLKHLGGHSAIPQLIGYRRAEHFEYLGMELLGKDIKGLIESGYALKPETVAKIGEQLASPDPHSYAFIPYLMTCVLAIRYQTLSFTWNCSS
jgi:serine/threonine protein kinase